MGKLVGLILQYLIKHPEVIEAGVQLTEKIVAAKEAKAATQSAAK